MEKTELQKKIERKGIVISRLPEWAKEVFKARAREEFCDDYGMCLAAMLKECGEYHKLKEMFFENNLNLKKISEQKEDNEKSIKFANGKIIKYDGGTK